MTNTEMIAVVGNGSWGGPSKVHAAPADSGALPDDRWPVSYRGERLYTSLCGVRYLYEYKARDGVVRPFVSTIPVEQCGRCCRILRSRAVARGPEATDE